MPSAGQSRAQTVGARNLKGSRAAEEGRKQPHAPEAANPALPNWMEARFEAEDQHHPASDVREGTSIPLDSLSLPYRQTS